MTTQEPNFNMEAAIKALREGKDLTGKDGVLTPLIEQLTESAIQAELDSRLAEDSDTPNRKERAVRRRPSRALLVPLNTL